MKTALLKKFISINQFSLTVFYIGFVLLSTTCTSQSTTMNKSEYKVQKTEEEWKKELTTEQYNILREKGTELAFTGVYWNNTEDGVYRCAGCDVPLFSADTKYKSGSGWPSFWDPINANNVKIVTDNSLGMTRDEVVCGNCGGHLGHMFNDGPEPTGLRYCLNSAALDFEEENK